jgi:hypothetical protein
MAQWSPSMFFDPKTYRIINARNAQLIPITRQSGLMYTIAINCNNAEATVRLREQIDPEGKKTRAKNNIIYIIQGNENDFAKQFPEISQILNRSEKKDDHDQEASLSSQKPRSF